MNFSIWFPLMLFCIVLLITEIKGLCFDLKESYNSTVPRFFIYLQIFNIILNVFAMIFITMVL